MESFFAVLKTECFYNAGELTVDKLMKQIDDYMDYSGLNLNQDKATKPQTVQIVRQGEATRYWFKVNPLYYNRERCSLKLKKLSPVAYRTQLAQSA